MNSRRMLTFFIVIAIVLAITGFLLVRFITQEPEIPPVLTPTPAGGQTGQTIQVDGTFVTLQRDPNQAVQLVPLAPPPQEQQQNGGDPGQTNGEPGDPPAPTATTPPPTPVPPTATPAPPPIPNTNVDDVIFVQHTVGPNDTLYSISNQYNTSIELMAERGQGIDIEDIVAGNQIQVPIPNPDYCPGILAYAVRENDTVFRIAQEFNTSREEIRNINNLGENYSIKINQILCIP